MLKGQLYKGMNSRRLGHLEATLEVAFYMVCIYLFEIDPGKGICGGEGGGRRGGNPFFFYFQKTSQV